MAPLPPDKIDWRRKAVFTTGEAAAACGVSQQTIIRCFDAGRLGGYRVPGSRFRRIPRAELIAFMKENRIDPSAILNGRIRVAILVGDARLARATVDRLAANDRFEIETATVPWTAGILVGWRRPNIVVLDLDMIGVDPALAIAAIREASETNIVIIALAKDPAPATVRSMRRAKVAAIVERMQDTNTVATRIAEAVSQARAS